MTDREHDGTHTILDGDEIETNACPECQYARGPGEVACDQCGFNSHLNEKRKRPVPGSAENGSKKDTPDTRLAILITALISVAIFALSSMGETKTMRLIIAGLILGVTLLAVVSYDCAKAISKKEGRTRPLVNVLLLLVGFASLTRFAFNSSLGDVYETSRPVVFLTSFSTKKSSWPILLLLIVGWLSISSGIGGRAPLFMKLAYWAAAGVFVVLLAQN